MKSKNPYKVSWQDEMESAKKKGWDEGYEVGVKEIVNFVEQEGVMYQYSDTLTRWEAKLDEVGYKESK